MDRADNRFYREKSGERDAKDYAIEFAGYMASAAKRYMEVSALSYRDPDELRDTFSALGSAIYEFEKRAERAKR